MGGKSKQSQRTKNNARPSNSGRSAELLSSNLGPFSSVLINGDSVKAPIFSTLTDVTTTQYVNPEFMLCIKKLSKKDPITKTKALKELNELIKTCSDDDVIETLQHWARLYPVLSIDPDHKVREATQTSHGVLVQRAGRHTARVLRALAPSWLAAAHDPYAPAALAAHASLQKTFPGEKLAELVSFCKEEVMTYIIDNVIGKNATMAPNSEEEARRRELAAAGCVGGVRGVAAALRGPAAAWLWPRLLPLLRAPAFWAFQRAAPALRASWFLSMSTLVSRFPQQLIAEAGPRLARLLLAASRASPTPGPAPSSDAPAPAPSPYPAPAPPACPQLWACFVALLHHTPEYPLWTEKQSELSKRIIELLENGGHGDASATLPLLASLPIVLRTENFYEQYFNALFTGLDNKSILTSKSERQQWIASLAECMKYVSVQQIDEFAVPLLTNIHRIWLVKIFGSSYDGAIRSNILKHSATNMAGLVKYWLKLFQQGKSDKYDELVRNFWQNIKSTISNQIDNFSTDHNTITDCIESHILLLHTLKMPEVRKQRSIKFEGDPQNDTENIEAPKEKIEDPMILDRYNHNLNDSVCLACTQYFDFARRKEISSPVLSPLVSLLKEFDSKKLFMAIGDVGEHSVYELYEKTLQPWLSSEIMRCEVLVDIVFLLYKYLTEEEQKAFFESLNEASQEVGEWCLRRCAGGGGGEGWARWARGARGAGAAEAAARRVLLAARPADVTALLCCFAHDRHHNILISDAAVADILTMFSSALQDLSNEHLDRIASVASQLLCCIHNYDAIEEQYLQIIMDLFSLNLNIPWGSGSLSAETRRESREAWRDALQRPLHGARLLPLCVRRLQRHLTSNEEDLDIERIDHTVTVSTGLLKSFNDTSSPDECVAHVSTLMKDLFDFQREKVPMEAYALLYDCTMSHLSCPIKDDNDIMKMVTDPNFEGVIEKPDFLLFANRNLFQLMFLKNVILGPNRTSLADKDKVEAWCSVVLSDANVRNEFMNILHVAAIIDTLNEGYAFLPMYSMIKETKEQFDAILKEMSDSMSEETRETVWADAEARSLRRGYYWSCARAALALRLGRASPPLPAGCELARVLLQHGSFHQMQADLKYGQGRSPEREDAAARLVLIRALREAHGRRAGVAAPLLRSLGAAPDLQPLVEAYYRDNAILLYERDIWTAEWAAVVSDASVLEALRAGVALRGWTQDTTVWDFTTITLCSLLSSLQISLCSAHRPANQVAEALLLRSTLRLFATVARFVHDVPAECTKREPSAAVAELPREWDDIFAPDLHYNFFLILLRTLENDERAMSVQRLTQMAALVEALPSCRWAALSAARRHELSLSRLATAALAALAPAPAPASPSHPAPASPSHPAPASPSHPAPAPASPSHPARLYLAHAALLALVPDLLRDDEDKISAWKASAAASEEERAEREGREGTEETEGEEREATAPPALSVALLEPALQSLHALLDAALSTVAVGDDSCLIQPFTDSFGVALAALLLQQALAALADGAADHLATHYIHFYRESSVGGSLVEVALRLMPPELLQAASERLLYYFHQPYSPSITEAPSAAQAARLACAALRALLAGAGAGAARAWWGGAPPRAAAALLRVVRVALAPALVRAQLAAVVRAAAAAAARGSPLRVTARPSTRELQATLTLDERPLRLELALDEAHPLRPPSARAATPAGWDGAALALFAQYQRSPLWRALQAWAARVSRRLARVPECYVCYSRLHPASGRLPAVPCRTCHNKFHTECFQKWVSTSGKSTCPLCRAKM